MRKLITTLSIFTLATPLYGGVLEKVQKRASLNCGVDGTLPGFSLERKGYYTGFDVDFCKAVAAAINVKKINYVPLKSHERLIATREGRVDVLSRTTTWTFERDSHGLSFIGAIFYDGEGFMTKNFGSASVKDLPSAKFCILKGTTSEGNIKAFMNDLPYSVVTFKDRKSQMAAFREGRCNVYTYDRSGLVGLKASMPDGNTYQIMNDVVSKEPLGPVVADGDKNWEDIVRWTYFALITAEELDLDSRSFEKQDLNNSQAHFLAGGSTAAQKRLGLDPNWVKRILRTTGSYGEIYERHLGAGSSLKIQRGLNKTWKDGGLHYAPPF